MVQDHLELYAIAAILIGPVLEEDAILSAHLYGVGVLVLRLCESLESNPTMRCIPAHRVALRPSGA